MAMHVVIVDRADAATLNQVHEALKAHTDGWWHWFQAAWIIASSMTAAEVRDVIGAAIQAPAAVLVIELPESGRTWAYRGKDAEERCKWLRDNYNG